RGERPRAARPAAVRGRRAGAGGGDRRGRRPGAGGHARRRGRADLAGRGAGAGAGRGRGRAALAGRQDARVSAPLLTPPDRRGRPDRLLRRGLGVPWLFASAYSAVGFSIYFSLGVVADRGLGLTPLIFLAAGLLFGLTALTYVEGGAMFRERGGSSTFARHAFNELVAFVAGWAILIDYLIVLALAAISVPHYLSPISGALATGGWEIGIAVAVIAAACLLNVFNVTGREQQRPLALLALADLGLQLLVVLVGLLGVMHPERLTAGLQVAGQPGFRAAVYAAVLAMLAYAGIEAASDLAPEVRVSRRDLKRIASLATLAVPLIYAGMAAI